MINKEKAKRDKTIAELYKQELSAPAIGKKLSLTLRQVYRSLENMRIARRARHEQSRISFANKPLSFAYVFPKTEKEKLLEASALMLYKGEGAKGNSTVDLANSDEVVLKIFLNYLRKICRVDEKRLKFYLYCFSDQNPQGLIKYWSRQLVVSQQAFTKPYVRKLVKPRGPRVMPNGVLHIRYSDKKLLRLILARIDQLAEKMVK